MSFYNYPTLYCVACTAAVAKAEIIERSLREIIIFEKASIAINTHKRSNLLRCKNCNKIIGIKNKNKYILFTGEVIKINLQPN